MWFPKRWQPAWVAVGSLACALAVLRAGAGAGAEQNFPSPEAAVAALVQAAQNGDTNAIHAIFGPTGHELISPDVVQATEDFRLFVRRLLETAQCTRNSESNATLELGREAWPFPIPLVREAGQWHFDTAAGKEEIFARRIGRNELGAIAVCHAYVEAQREYAAQDRLGDGVPAYAQFLASRPGTHDGLYWPAAAAGGEASPFGPLIAQARGEGYPHPAHMLNEERAPYQGYYYKILTRQGGRAPGGKFDYRIHGRLLAGFAFVAWPAEWGDTGVMTFMVNQQGRVYQKNLGPKTAKLAAAMRAYDPDATWHPAD